MTWERRRYLAGRTLLAAGLVYELGALVSPLPTITELVKRGLRHRYGRLAIWALCGFAVDHFWRDLDLIVDERSDP